MTFVKHVNTMIDTKNVRKTREEPAEPKSPGIHFTEFQLSVGKHIITLNLLYIIFLLFETVGKYEKNVRLLDEIFTALRDQFLS